jgi:hypothetical protein
VGRIYSTASGSTQPAQPAQAAQPAPSETDRSAGPAPSASADPTVTDPQWYPLADPPGAAGDEWPSPEAAVWSPESRAAYQHAVQQHAAHQHAIQQRRTDRQGDA